MLSILYVDDESALLDVGKLFLERGGQCSVDTITSASDALILLTTKIYDAIISDYQMPAMDGITFLKKIRNSGNTIPFIIFTGRGREEIAIQAINEGADFYVQKGGSPIAQFTDLEHKIRQAVQQRQAEVCIRDHERREADIINFLPDATFAIDINGLVIAWNRAMENITGVKAAEILGKGNFEYAISGYNERRPVLIDLVLSEDPDLLGKYPLLKRDGKTLIAETTTPFLYDGRGATISVTAAPLFNNRGEIVGAIESIRDVTDSKLAELSLQERNSQINALIDTLPFDIWAMDCSGQCVLQNKVSVRHWGSSIGKNSEQIPISPDLLEHWQENNRKAFSGNLVKGELSVQSDDGVRTYEEIISPVRFGDEIKGIIGVNIDITDRKRAEKALQESEEKFRLLVENTHDIIYMLTADGVFTFISPAWTILLGHPVNQVIGKSFKQFVHPEDIADCMKFLQSVIITGQRQEGIEYRVKHIDGTWHWHTSSAVPIKDEQSSIAGFYGNAHDITERKKTEEALRESEEKYRELVENANSIILKWDKKGNVTFYNEFAQRFFGYSNDEIIGKSVMGTIVPATESGSDRDLSLMIEDIIRHPENHIFSENENVARDGRRVWIRWQNKPLYDENGQFSGLFSIGTDITGRKLAEEALNQVNKKLKLLSGITRHDIGNQITVLRGYLSILEMNQADPSQKKYFQEVDAAASQISDMIQFTKEYESIGVRAPIWQDCRGLVEIAARQISLGRIIIKNDIQIGTQIFADPLIIKVFYNLIDNAVMHGKKITNIRFFVEERDCAYLVVCEDDGIGVLADEKEQIFDQGFGKNTGLGLFLAREILDITGITIQETGDPGKRARFEMTVPKNRYRIHA